MTQYDPSVFLRQIYPATIGTHQFTLSDAIATMVRCRELLEMGSLQENYQVLNLYCNWTVHTELEGSTAAYRTLIEATELVLNSNDTSALSFGISRLLSFAELRAEFIRLFKSVGVPTHVFETGVTWRMFVGQFLKAIIGKKLLFPPNPETKRRSAKSYERFLALAGDRLSDAPKSIQLVQSDKNEVHWSIEHMNGTVTTGPFVNLETQSAFAQLGFYVDGKPSLGIAGTSGAT